MSNQALPETAFILSLIGGIFMFVGGGTMWLIFGGMPYYWMMGMGHMPGASYPFAFLSMLFIVGIVSGIIVIIGAVMLRSRPEQYYTWAILILVFSIISLIGMGGFFIGALLGIAGGALALSWRPRRAT
jgi:hypothetical protein